MKLATWNIRAGGGRRIGRIADVILDERPDILVLAEFRSGPGRELLKLLRPLGYQTRGGTAEGATNCVCVLSRHPVHKRAAKPVPMSAHRWACVSVPSLGVEVLGVHVPNQAEVWNKREFWDCVGKFARKRADRRAIILGDLNTALDEDCEGDPIREAVYFKELLAAGWVDAWRDRNPQAREFSWYSHRANGFRLDHCLVSPVLADSVREAVMRHDVRTDRLSDHSLLIVELDL